MWPRGEPSAMIAAMAAAVLFGAVHALMPGTVRWCCFHIILVSPASREKASPTAPPLTLTHVGLAGVLVLAGFSVISRLMNL